MAKKQAVTDNEDKAPDVVSDAGKIKGLPLCEAALLL